MIIKLIIFLKKRLTLFLLGTVLSSYGLALGQTQTPTPGLPTNQTIPLSPDYVLYLSILATAGLIVMWLVFWLAVWKSKENIHEILLSTGFFRTVVVMGVVAATVVLSLAGRLEGQITGAILSGIVGYVLGQISNRGHQDEKNKRNRQ